MLIHISLFVHQLDVNTGDRMWIIVEFGSPEVRTKLRFFGYVSK